jgi:uncharacterized OsmC-like protein
MDDKQQRQKTMKEESKNEPEAINGIDTIALRGAIEAIAENLELGQTNWRVSSEWRGGTRSDARVTQYQIGGERIEKDFTIQVDEPFELCGSNQFPNPQEYLLAALNACMMVGYAALCALEGIELDELRIETEGDIDLRGFLGIDGSVRPGYDQLRQTVVLRGDGTPEQFERIHSIVLRSSPNYFNVSTAVPVRARLVVGQAGEAGVLPGAA